MYWKLTLDGDFVVKGFWLHDNFLLHRNWSLKVLGNMGMQSTAMASKHLAHILKQVLWWCRDVELLNSSGYEGVTCVFGDLPILLFIKQGHDLINNCCHAHPDRKVTPGTWYKHELVFGRKPTWLYLMYITCESKVNSYCCQSGLF